MDKATFSKICTCKMPVTCLEKTVFFKPITSFNVRREIYERIRINFIKLASDLLCSIFNKCATVGINYICLTKKQARVFPVYENETKHISLITDPISVFLLF